MRIKNCVYGFWDPVLCYTVEVLDVVKLSLGRSCYQLVASHLLVSTFAFITLKMRILHAWENGNRRTCSLPIEMRLYLFCNSSTNNT
jgi:hypothetical protein